MGDNYQTHSQPNVNTVAMGAQPGSNKCHGLNKHMCKCASFYKKCKPH